MFPELVCSSNRNFFSVDDKVRNELDHERKQSPWLPRKSSFDRISSGGQRSKVIAFIVIAVPLLRPFSRLVAPLCGLRLKAWISKQQIFWTQPKEHSTGELICDCLPVQIYCRQKTAELYIWKQRRICESGHLKISF